MYAGVFSIDGRDSELNELADRIRGEVENEGRNLSMGKDSGIILYFVYGDSSINSR